MERPTDEEIENARKEVEKVIHDGYATEELRDRKIVQKEILVNERLIYELEELRGSIDSYRTWSRRLTLTLIVIGVLQLLFRFL